MLFLSHIALSPAKMAQIRSISAVLEAIPHIVVPHETQETTRHLMPEAQILSDHMLDIADLAHEPSKLASAIIDWALQHEIRVISAPHTPLWMRVMSMVAASFQVPYIGGVLPQFLPRIQRSTCAGKLIETLETPRIPFCTTIAGDGVAPDDAKLKILCYFASYSPQICAIPTLSSFTAFKRDLIKLDGARIVFAGGRGLGNQASFDKLAQCAAKYNAALAASRVAVDLGWCRNDLQVGQTGLSISPDIYVAFGISGAIQHIAGIRNARKIIAINTDKDAPIFTFANIGLIADVQDVMNDLLTEN